MFLDNSHLIQQMTKTTHMLRAKKGHAVWYNNIRTGESRMKVFKYRWSFQGEYLGAEKIYDEEVGCDYSDGRFIEQVKRILRGID